MRPALCGLGVLREATPEGWGGRSLYDDARSRTAPSWGCPLHGHYTTQNLRACTVVNVMEDGRGSSVPSCHAEEPSLKCAGEGVAQGHPSRQSLPYYCYPGAGNRCENGADPHPVGQGSAVYESETRMGVRRCEFTPWVRARFWFRPWRPTKPCWPCQSTSRP